MFKATDPRIGRAVAIKVLTAAADDPDLLARFYREAKYTGGLQHQNIVTVYELGHQDGIPYLVIGVSRGSEPGRSHCVGTADAHCGKIEDHSASLQRPELCAQTRLSSIGISSQLILSFSKTVQPNLSISGLHVAMWKPADAPEPGR